MPNIRNWLGRLRAGSIAKLRASGPTWAGAIAIPSSSTDYEVLPSVKEISRGTPWISFDTSTLERDLESYIADDPYPIPTTADREGYHGDRHYDYWLSGLKDYLLLRRALRSCGASALLQQGSALELAAPPAASCGTCSATKRPPTCGQLTSTNVTSNGSADFWHPHCTSFKTRSSRSFLWRTIRFRWSMRSRSLPISTRSSWPGSPSYEGSCGRVVWPI